MEVKDQELWDAATAFLKECKSRRTHIIHDYDTDGISGGALLEHGIRRIGAKASSSFAVGRGAGLEREHLMSVKELYAPERIIITDQDPKSFGHYESYKEIFGDIPTMIIDHHFVKEYEDAIFVHPEPIYGIEGSKYPSALLIHDLIKAVAPAEDLKWLACVGILGDAGGHRFRDFLERTAGYEDIELPIDPYHSAFGTIAEAIDCCGASSAEELIGYGERLKGEETLKGALAIGNPCSHVKEELDDYVSRGLDLAETHGPIVWLNVQSKYGINSWVSTLLSMNHRERIIMVYREYPDSMHVSARYQDAKVHLGEIIKAIVTPLGGAGGGHAPASGGRVPKEHWETFKRSFEEAVDQGLKGRNA